MTNTMPVKSPLRGGLSPFQITAIYGLVGSLWIPVTDYLLLRWIGNVRLLSAIQTAKGWFFILLTAVMLYGLIKRSMTVLHRAQRALREEHRLLTAVIEGTTDVIFVKDTRHRYVLINSAGAGLFGKNVDQVTGRADAELFSPDTARETMRQDRQVMEDDQSQTFESVVTTAGGMTRTYSVTKAPYRDAGGRIDGVIGIARDITARKQAEEALLESEARYRALVEHAPVCIHEIDRSGCLLAMNPAGLSMMRVKEEKQITGLTYLDCVAPADRERIAGLLRQAFEGRTLDFEVSLSLGGEERIFSSSFVPLRDRNGTVAKLMGCTQDITARKQAEEALREAHDQLERRVAERTAELSKVNAALQEEIAEHRRTEAALRESEERFRELAEHIQEVFWLASADGERVLYVSPAYEEIWGRRRESLYERPADWVDAIVVEDRSDVIRAYDELAAMGRFDQEYRILRPDGTLRWIRDRGFPIRDAEGRTQRIAGIAQDITATKLAELELRDRARQQVAVAEFSQRALAGIELANLLAEAVTMLARTLKVEYCEVLELLPDGQTMQLRAGVGFKGGTVGHATVTGGYASQAGYTLLSRQPVVVEDLRTETRFKATPLLREQGVISGISVIISDRDRPFGILGAHTGERRTFSRDDIHFLQTVANVLTTAIERRRTETALRIRDRALAATSNGVLITDPNEADNPIIYCNAAFEKMTGYSQAEVLDRNCRFLQGADRDQAPLGRIHDAVAEGRECRAVLRNYRRDGTPFWNELTISPVKDEAARLTHFVGIQNDITERRQAEERAQQQQLELTHMARLSLAGEMASGLAHELNQPLTAIRISAEAGLHVLMTDPEERDLLIATLKQVSAQSQRAGEIIRRMRDFTRKSESRRTPIDLNALVREVACFTEAEARQQQVSVHLDLADPLPKVFADWVQIQQVLTNLVRNAIEAMQDAPVGERALTIATRAAGAEGVEVRVCDSGPGLAAGAADRLFHPFFTTKADGMGLGLSISKSIIEAHRGRLGARPNPTRGTTFYFMLPVRDHE